MICQLPAEVECVQRGGRKCSNTSLSRSPSPGPCRALLVWAYCCFTVTLSAAAMPAAHG